MARTKQEAVEIAIQQSTMDRANYYHVHERNGNFTVSRYYDQYSVAVYKNGKIYPSK